MNAWLEIFSPLFLIPWSISSQANTSRTKKSNDNQLSKSEQHFLCGKVNAFSLW
jgi:hypothetical protein